MSKRTRPDLEAPRLRRQRMQERLLLMSQPQQDQRRELLEAVQRGFALQPKRLPPKFFYDAEGSLLFERITATEEYYPTRTEAGLLRREGAEILRESGRPQVLVELGSGSAAKTRLLLDRMADAPMEYVPIDVSVEALLGLAEPLLSAYPNLTIRALACDYHQALALLKEHGAGSKLVIFLGSSLGNYDPEQARQLLQLVRGALGPEDRFLLGLDLKKDPAVLHAAYNDAQGVTAAFNLNLLTRINRELGGHFDLERFRHMAFYNQLESRIEMHLESLESQIVPVDALKRSFTFRAGECLHTENSYKYDPSELPQMLAGTGLRLQRQWMDERGWFALNLLAPA